MQLKKAHELGNHTLYHPCRSSVISSVSRHESENYNAAIILREISILNSFLFAIDSNSGRTYAYPCSETSVGGKDYTDTLKRSALLKYARSRGDSNSVVTDFNHLNKFVVPSWGFANNPDAVQLISYAKKVQKAGGMGVFMFHGVGGYYLNVSADAHKNLLQYLKDQQKEIWVRTFKEVMDYITKE